MASELKQKTVKGLAWNSIQNLANHGIQFFLMLFMARLLGPKEYGIIGLTSVFLAISATFINSGFVSALVRKKDTTKDDYDTVFIFNMVISLFFFVLILIIAPYAADFYNEPILCPVLRVLALLLIINGLCAVQSTILTKDIDFKKKAKISVTQNIVSGIIGIIFAYLGYGVWALVIQALTSAAIQTTMLWTKTRWYPSFNFSLSSFKELFGYGSKMLASGLINVTYNQIYPIVIGKYFSPTTLGHYSRARHWSGLFSSNLTGILSGVAFPALAKIQDEEERLQSVYRRMIKTSCFVIFPSMFGMSAVAKPLVYVVIGEKWMFCAELLQIICFSAMWLPIHSLNLNLLQVKGRSDLFLKLEIIKKIFGVAILCVSIPLGIIAMCYFEILSSIIALIINTYYTGKLINVGFLKQMQDITPTLILSTVMFGAVFASIHYIDNYYTQLVVGIIIGAAIYLGGTYLLKFPELKEVITLYKDLKNRNR